MRYMVERNFVDVVGEIWQPGMGICSCSYDLKKSDLDNIGDFTRENVSRWLVSHAGDFQKVTDFYATAGDKVIPWETEDGEAAFIGCSLSSQD